MASQLARAGHRLRRGEASAGRAMSPPATASRSLIRSTHDHESAASPDTAASSTASLRTGGTASPRRKRDASEADTARPASALATRSGRSGEAIASPRGHAPANAAVQIIAEIKKASPSKGVLAETLDSAHRSRLHPGRRHRHLSADRAELLPRQPELPARRARRSGARIPRRPALAAAQGLPRRPLRDRRGAGVRRRQRPAHRRDAGAALLRDLIAEGRATSSSTRWSKSTTRLRRSARSKPARRSSASTTATSTPSTSTWPSRSASGRCCLPTPSSSARAACTTRATSSACSSRRAGHPRRRSVHDRAGHRREDGRAAA